MIANDVKITVETVDLSPYIKSFEWTPLKAIFETTSIDVTAVTRESGNGDNTLTIEFYQNMDADLVYSTLYSKIGVSTTTITIQLDESEATSAANPEFSFDAILESFPIGGGAGELMMSSCTFHGNGVITVSTS